MNDKLASLFCMTEKEQLELFDKIALGNEKAFEILFNAYYGPLCFYASRILGDDDSAEEIVQDAFAKIWEKKIIIATSVKNYLFTTIRNRCLNQLEQQKIRNLHARIMMEEALREPDLSPYFIDPGLADKIEAAILSLPEKRREIFRLNREEGLKYREIAERLQLSVKTVEAQMGLALKTLREKLKNFLLILFFFIFSRDPDKGK